MRFATNAAWSGPEARGRDLAGAGEWRQRRTREPVPSGRCDRGRKRSSGELSGRFHAGPAWGKDPVHALQVRALLLPEPFPFRLLPLGFGTLQVVDKRDDARPGPLPGEVLAEERPVQQFVLQHHIGRSGRIRGVPAPAVELANRHFVAARPKPLGEHPVVDVSAGHGPKRRPPDLDPPRHSNFVPAPLVSHPAIRGLAPPLDNPVRTGCVRGGAHDPNET